MLKGFQQKTFWSDGAAKQFDLCELTETLKRDFNPEGTSQNPTSLHISARVCLKF